MASQVMTASSATGKSLVPAATTATRPGRGSGGCTVTRKARAVSWMTAPGTCSATRASVSAEQRVARTLLPCSRIRFAIATTCAEVLPAPKMVSGNPFRSAR